MTATAGCGRQWRRRRRRQRGPAGRASCRSGGTDPVVRGVPALPIPPQEARTIRAAAVHHGQVGFPPPVGAGDQDTDAVPSAGNGGAGGAVLLDVGCLITDPNIGGAEGGRRGRRVRMLDVGSLGPPERRGCARHWAGPQRPWGRLQRSSVLRPWVNNLAAWWT